MPKIDIEALPLRQGTRYPAPHDRPCRGREWRALVEAAGLTQFGVNLLRLKPGDWSSQRHWHEKEDEFVYVLEGEATLIEDAGRSVLRAGDCAAWKAGVRDGHHLVNESASDAVLLVVGSRDDSDHGEYSDIDMKFAAGRYSGDGGYFTKDGKKIA